MISSKFGILILIFAFCILNFTGCAIFPKKDTQPSGSALLEPQAILKFGDIPVPVGFKLLAKDSYAFESFGMRVGVLRYKGKANPDLVVKFYKEQMPMYNWNLLNVVEYGDRLMNFDRENETCVIGLSPVFRGNLITISVGPKSQVTKKPKQPIK
jgi:hypothetical protein